MVKKEGNQRKGLLFPEKILKMCLLYICLVHTQRLYEEQMKCYAQ